MNKRGGYFVYIILLLVLITGFAVQQNPDLDIEALKDNFSNHTIINVSVESQPDLSNAINSLSNGLLDCMVSIARWGVDWAAENPTVPFKLLVYLAMLAILAPIIVVLFKLLIIIFLLIKEYFQSRKERRITNGIR